MEERNRLIKQDNISKFVQSYFMEMETLRLLVLLRILQLKDIH